MGGNNFMGTASNRRRFAQSQLDLGRFPYNATFIRDANNNVTMITPPDPRNRAHGTGNIRTLLTSEQVEAGLAGPDGERISKMIGNDSVSTVEEKVDKAVGDYLGTGTGAGGTGAGGASTEDMIASAQKANFTRLMYGDRDLKTGDIEEPSQQLKNFLNDRTNMPEPLQMNGNRSGERLSGGAADRLNAMTNRGSGMAQTQGMTQIQPPGMAIGPAHPRDNGRTQGPTSGMPAMTMPTGVHSTIDGSSGVIPPSPGAGIMAGTPPGGQQGHLPGKGTPGPRVPTPPEASAPMPEMISANGPTGTPGGAYGPIAERANNGTAGYPSKSGGGGQGGDMGGDYTGGSIQQAPATPARSQSVK